MKPARKILPWIAVILLVVFQFILAMEWLNAHMDYFHPFQQEQTLAKFKLLSRDGGVPWRQLLQGESYYPPGHPLLFSVFHVILGVSRINFTLGNYLLLALASLALYGLGRRMADEIVGLGAVVLFLFHPLVFLNAPVPCIEIVLAALVVIYLYCLESSSGFVRTVPSLGAALAFAVGMLVKWTFVIYVMLPLLLFVFGQVRLQARTHERPGRIRLLPGQIKNLIAAGAVIFLLLAPWYLGVLDWSYLIKSGSFEPHSFSSPIQQLTSYAGFVFHGVHPRAYVIVLAGLVLAGCLPKKGYPQAMAVVWFVAGYAVLTGIPHHQARYALPLLPAFGLLVMMGADAIRFAPLKPILLVFVAVMGAGFYAEVMVIGSNHPNETGMIDPYGSGACIGAERQTVKALLERVEQQAADLNEKDPLRLAYYPFGKNFSSDRITFGIRMNNLDKSRRQINKLGYEISSYHHMVDQFEKIDILLMGMRAYQGDRAPLEAGREEWGFSSYVPEKARENFTFPRGDPFLLKRIHQHFKKVGVFGPPCFEPGVILKRKSASKATEPLP